MTSSESLRKVMSVPSAETEAQAVKGRDSSGLGLGRPCLRLGESPVQLEAAAWY